MGSEQVKLMPAEKLYEALLKLHSENPEYRYDCSPCREGELFAGKYQLLEISGSLSFIDRDPPSSSSGLLIMPDKRELFVILNGEGQHPVDHNGNGRRDSDDFNMIEVNRWRRMAQKFLKNPEELYRRCIPKDVS